MKKLLFATLLGAILAIATPVIGDGTVSWLDGVSAINPNLGDGNTGVGSGACDSITTGMDDSCFGEDAGTSITTGDQNTSVGSGSLVSVTTTGDNTAVGYNSLNANTAANNTAVGSGALDVNVAGARVTAVGVDAGGAQSTATDNDNTWIGYNSGLLADAAASGAGRNTCVGSQSCDAQTTATDSVAVGYNALSANTSGGNTAVGSGALDVNVAGVRNVSVGQNSGGAQAAAGDDDNTFVGYNAGLLANGSASGGNTAVGSRSLDAAVTTVNATAVGFQALSASTADGNTAVGKGALDVNVTGLRNVALGEDAGGAQTGETDDDNTWIGYNAGLLANGSASGGNTGIGSRALDALTSGISSTAVGASSSSALSTGAHTTAFGYRALAANTNHDNTAVGSQSLDANVAGTRNTAVGRNSGGSQSAAGDDDNTWLGHAAGQLANGSDSGGNAAVGSLSLSALTTGINNTAVGFNAGLVVTTGSDNIFLGNALTASAVGITDEYVIGHDITGGGTETTTIGNATDSIVNDWGENATWTHSSDFRMKNIIGTSSLGLEFINLLSAQVWTKKPASELPTEWGVPTNAYINTAKKYHGLVAQDVRSALDAFGIDNFGGWAQRANGKQAVGDAAFVPALINAVNELTARVKRLERENEELKR